MELKIIPLLTKYLRSIGSAMVNFILAISINIDSPAIAGDLGGFSRSK
jgi:hypothetical protein